MNKVEVQYIYSHQSHQYRNKTVSHVCELVIQNIRHNHILFLILNKINTILYNLFWNNQIHLLMKVERQLKREQLTRSRSHFASDLGRRDIMKLSYLLFWISDRISSSNELFSSPVGPTFPFRFLRVLSIWKEVNRISVITSS